MFIVAGQVVKYQMKWDATNHFYNTYNPVPTPLNAVDLQFNDFTFIGFREGTLIAGQMTYFEDGNGMPWSAPTLSGFYYGLEGVNSCVDFDTAYIANTEAPPTYLAPASHSEFGSENNCEVSSSSLNPTFTKLDKDVDYQEVTFLYDQ